MDLKATIESLKNKIILAGTDNEQPTDASNKNSSTISVKLPEIKLPAFSGKYEDWSSFINSFDSMVHENPLIPIIHKFYYLKTSLSGEAAAHVQALKVTNENYEQARKILIETYDKRQYIIDAHLKALFLATNTKQSLKALLLLINQHVNALQSLKLEHHELFE